MRKNLMKVAVLAGLGLVGQLAATDFRAPIATQMGPLHYSFDKLHKKKSNFTYFTTAHFRETEDAFMKHGTETHPLSKLIFGKSEFYASESFQDQKTWEFGLTENYNPYLKTTKLAPRVSYSEAGVFFGANWDYPVWNNKGRIGIRGSLPIRWVRMERDDEAEANALGLQGDILKGEVRYVNPFEQGHAGAIGSISSYRLSFLRGLLYRTGDGRVWGAYQPLGNGNGVSLGESIYDGIGTQAGLSEYGSTNHITPFVVIKAAKAGEPPRGQGGAILVDTGTNQPVNQENINTTIEYPVNYNVAGGEAFNFHNPDELLADGSGPVSNVDPSLAGHISAVFVATDGAANPVDYTKLDLDKNSDLWATTVNGLNGLPIQTAKNSVDFIDGLAQYYGTDVEQWLADRGYVIATDEQTGLGDIPAEIFYEHSFNDSWRGELCLGVKFPTGNGGSDYSGNPFRVQMGNGSHWEIKIGALAAWQAIRCMNVKLDLSYNFALEKTEHRKASYSGAKIKNFGPEAKASVDWGYFLGNLDFNFTHPKSKKINGMIGYQLYYKTEDHINFKDKHQESWLGKVWGDPTTGKAADFQTPGTAWIDMPMKLSGDVASMNSEQWGHRIRLEGSYNLSKYCTTSVGGLYTFAGQNIPVEADVHCACQVRF